VADVRCPSCGARNAESATFCTQCFASFAPPPPPPPPPPATGTASGPTGPSELDLDLPLGGGPAADGPVEVLGDGRFRRGPEGMDWRCGVCQTWNPMERTTCAVCRARFGAEEDEGPTVRDDVPPALAVALGAALPGAGMFLLGRRATGIGHALLYLVWLSGAVVLLLGSAVDTWMLTNGSTQQVLTPRVLMWLVVAVIGLTTIAFLVAALSLGGTTGG
jgi:TM2 domain-containing membrane protein YozV